MKIIKDDYGEFVLNGAIMYLCIYFQVLTKELIGDAVRSIFVKLLIIIIICKFILIEQLLALDIVSGYVTHRDYKIFSTVSNCI